MLKAMRYLCVFAVIGLWLPGLQLADAQSDPPLAISFPPNQKGSVIEGMIKGAQIDRYSLSAQQGQMMFVDMLSPNGTAYFNIQRIGADQAIFVGATTGTVADISVPQNGTYEIMVYLMRSAARRDEAANYTLTVGLQGPDFADGLAGGPDYWKVADVGGGDLLNVRRGPSTRYAVIGKLANGDAAQNKGCRLTLDQRWCKIHSASNGLSGWVAGRFLVEGAAPQRPAMPAGGPKGNGVPFDATGHIQCTINAEPLKACPFGVIRNGVGNAGIWIATGTGKDRHILFENYKPVTSNAPAQLNTSPSTAPYKIQLGTERYEIPRAVIDGG